MVEYNALLFGLKVAKEMGGKNLKTYSHSMLIVYQVHEEYEDRYGDLISYYKVAPKMRK